MALSFLPPTEIKSLSFLDTPKSHCLPKLPGGFALKMKDIGKALAEQSSVLLSHPLQHGQDECIQSLVIRLGMVQSLYRLLDQLVLLELRH